MQMIGKLLINFLNKRKNKKTEIDKNYVLEKINYARKNRVGYVFKNLLPETPSWENIINHFNYEYNNTNAKYYKEWIENGYFESDVYEQYGEIVKNGALFYKNKDLYVSFSTNDASKFYSNIKEIESLFQEVLEDPSAKFRQVFINFVSNQDQIAMHLDQRETIFWLFQGEVTWVLADPDDWSKTTKYKLKAGDVMFAPWGLPHTVESHSPRAGIILPAHAEDFDYLEKLNKKLNKDNYNND